MGASKRIRAAGIVCRSRSLSQCSPSWAAGPFPRRTLARPRYTVRVPNGLAFSEFRGYEGWQTVSVSQNEKVMAVILANPVMIKAYQSGIPGNGKPFPTAPRWRRSIGTRKARDVPHCDGAGKPA